MLTLYDLPYELLIKISQIIDARKILINKQLYGYILPYIRNNYVYSYPITRASNKFEEPYPRIYSELNELPDTSNKLLKNCEIVYNFYYPQDNGSDKVDFLTNNTKFKELYFHSDDKVNIKCIPKSVKVLSIRGSTSQNESNFEHLQNLTHLHLLQNIGVFDISKNMKLEHITLPVNFGGVIKKFPENLKSIVFQSYCRQSIKNCFSNNIKSLSFYELSIEQINYLPKNIESLSIEYTTEFTNGQVFPNFLNLKYLKLKYITENLIFLNLPNKLEYFNYPGKLPNEIEFPKELRIVRSCIHKNIMNLKKLEKVTFVTHVLDNEFIKLFNILEFSNVPAYFGIEYEGLYTHEYLSNLDKIIIPKGVKCCGIFNNNNCLISDDPSIPYTNSPDLTPNIIFSEDVETLECFYFIYTNMYANLPKNITTIRYYINPNYFDDCIPYFTNIPDFVETVEFDETMTDGNHFLKIKDTVKVIKYNITRKNNCEFFSIELADGRKIIQYSNTKY